MATTDAATPAPHAHIPRIQAEELAELLRESSKRPVVIDVRDPGTTGGFIRGARSVPRVRFDDREALDALVRELMDESLVVFHCLNCNNRGPTAALIFQNRLDELVPADSSHKPIVKILHRGFKVFSEQFGQDEELVDPNPLPL
ncbi:hypothetical protein ATCC90586_000400 [Pythium insidiosum]|nr:hypothetical protein ATCC90586_000400 [Pythium insidiosum]